MSNNNTLILSVAGSLIVILLGVIMGMIGYFGDKGVNAIIFNSSAVAHLTEQVAGIQQEKKEYQDAEREYRNTVKTKMSSFEVSLNSINRKVNDICVAGKDNYGWSKFNCK